MSDPAEPPRIWLLLGERRGDNNQLLALGEALGLPFETRTLRYGLLSRARMKLQRSGIGHVARDARRWLTPPWPDLVIGIGRRSVPVARWIRRASGGRARLGRLGHPRAPNEWFDLVLTTPQYPVPPGDNVVALPLAMNRFRTAPAATADEQAWLDSLPRPHLLLSLGGTAPMWRLDLAALREAAARLAARAATASGSLIVIASPRTPARALDMVRDAAPSAAMVEGELRYAVALADADEQFVTADSVSMMSEAIMSRKPVGLIPVEPDARGRRRLIGRDPGSTRIRDPRRFWAEVQSHGLVGTVDDPRCGSFEDPVEMAVAALRQRLGGLFE